MTAAQVDLQYSGGWTLQHTPGPKGWDRVAVRGDRRIEQGRRTYEQFLAALDRIDGRKVLTDYIAGLQAGLSQEGASKPLPFGLDGEPLPAAAIPVAQIRTAPMLPCTERALALVGVQQSLFGGDEW